MDGTQGFTVPPTKVDLSLIPLDDIIAELFKRHNSVVLATCIYKDFNNYQVLHRYSGHKQTCLALASNLQYRINMDELNSLRPTKEI